MPPAGVLPIVVVSFAYPPSLSEPAEPALELPVPAEVAVEAPQPAMEAQPSIAEPQPPLEAHQLKVVEFEAAEMTVQLPIDKTEQGKEARDVPCPFEAALGEEAAVIVPEPKQSTPRPAFSLSATSGRRHMLSSQCGQSLVL